MALKHLAQAILESLEPYCDRIDIAGSIRRGKPDPHDIEIVCIPITQVVDKDLFSVDVLARKGGFILAVKTLNPVKGDPYEGKYIKCEFPSENYGVVQIDIFTATPENYGGILAIRTGPSEFSHYCLAKRAHRFGMKFEGGILLHKGVPLRSEDEGQIFEHLRMPWIHPKDRGDESILDKYGCK